MSPGLDDQVQGLAKALTGIRGIDAVPADLFARVKAVNHEDIETISAGLTTIAWRRYAAR
jgi:hypothetical protein